MKHISSVSILKLCLFAVPLLLTACSKGGNRTCLGGPLACGLGDEITETQSGDTTLGFSCSATAVPSRVRPGETVRVQVDVNGTTETVSIPGQVTGFSRSVSLQGTYDASRAGTVVQKTVEVRSSTYGSAYCTFQVEVANATDNDSTNLGCRIDIEESVVRPGGSAHLRFTALNATGTSTFTHLYASSSWRIDDSLITPISASVSGVGVRYDVEGLKQISVKVRNAGREALCSRRLRVGEPGIVLTASPALSAGIGGQIHLAAELSGYTTVTDVAYAFTSSDNQAQIHTLSSNTARIASTRGSNHEFPIRVVASGSGISATKTETLRFSNTIPLEPLSGCTLQSAPLGFALDQSAPSLAGSLTRLRTQARGGQGPFQTVLVAVNGQSHAPTYDTYPGHPLSNGNQLVMRLRKPGVVAITVQLRDLGDHNRTTTCGTYHSSKPADLMVVGADQAESGSFGPRVRLLRGPTTQWMEDFNAFDANFRGGVRVTLGDFDGDGIADILAGRGYGTSGPGIRVFRGTDTVNFAGKPAPALMAEVGAVFHGSTPTRVYVAAGDVNSDGKSEAVIGAGCDAAAPRVKIFTRAGGTMNVISDFAPYAGSGGAHVATGDVDRDGYADVIVSPCVGTVIRVFSGRSITQNWTSGNLTATPTLIRQVDPVPGYQSEVKVAAGDIDGDGYTDIITGYNGHVDGGGRVANSVRAYSGATSGLILNFDAFSYPGGRPASIYKVAAADFNCDGITEILVGGNYPGAQPEVRVFDVRGWTSFGYIYRFASLFAFTGSIYLGAGAGSL